MGAVEQPARARADLPASLATAASRTATFGLATVPLALGVGHFAAIHIADAPDIWFQYRGVLVYLVDVIVLLTCVAWIVSRSRGERVPIAVASPILLALAIASLASAWWAIDRAVAVAVAAHLALLALFAAAAADLASRGDAVWKGFAIAVIAQSAVAAWQALTQSTAPFGALFNGWPREFAARESVAVIAAFPGIDRWLRAYGTFPHPNILAYFLAVALPLLALRARGSGLASAALVAGTAALALAVSRTAWLALTLAFLAWLLTTRSLRHVPASMAIALRTRPVVAAIVAAGLLLAGARAARLDAPPETNTFEQRAAYDQAAWSLVRDGAPVGAGNILITEQRRGIPVGEPAHNVFLITLAELGPIAIVTWLAIAGLVLISIGRARDPASRRAALVTAALLLPILGLDHYLWTGTPGRTLLALGLALVPLAVARARTSGRLTHATPGAHESARH